MSLNNRRFRAVAAALMVTAALSGCGALKKKPHSTPTIGKRVPILSKIDSGSKVDESIAGVPVMVPAAEVNPDFPQGGGSASKAMGNLAFADAPQRVWTAKIAGSFKRARLAAAPVIGNGVLYVFDTDGVVHAFDAANGSPKWRYTFDLKDLEKTGTQVRNSVRSAVFGGGVSFDDGKVYVTTGLGEVAALDAATGAVKWKVKPAGPLRGSPTIAFGAVYVMTQDNQIQALSITDGSLLWSASGAVSQQGVFGVGSPAAGQGTIIAGYSSGELAAYRYENGRELWTDSLSRTNISTSVSTLTDIDADPIIDNGRVYALGQGGRMVAYELVTGQRIWELSIAGISTPVVAGDWLFTLTDDGRMLCIARDTGKVRWIAQLREFDNQKKKTGQIFWRGPVLADGRLFIANSHGEVLSLNTTDGSTTPFTNLKEPVSLPPVLANKTMYILDDSGRISAFR